MHLFSIVTDSNVIEKKRKTVNIINFCLGSDYNNADVLTKSPTSVEAGKLFNIHTSDTSKQNARGQA